MSLNDWQTLPIKTISENSKRKLSGAIPKTVKIAKTRDNVDTSNRFSPISVDDEGSDDPSVSHNPTPTKEQPKPPPIIIPNVNNINIMINNFCKIITKQDFKFTTTRDSQIKIMVQSIDAYRKLVKYLDSSETIFHTYQLKQERAYRIVIKNLHHTTNIEEIKNELLTYGHDARSVINVRQRATKEPLSMFYVDLEPKDNNKDAYQINHINNAIVKVEPPRKFNDIVQCHRCQEFGHTKAYCKKAYKCVKCALDHASSECKKVSDTPPKCVHCLKNHTANYKGCQYYQFLINKKKHNNPFQTTSNFNPRTSLQNGTSENVIEYLSPEQGARNNDYSIPQQGESYANICKGQNVNNNENRLMNKLEGMLEKQMDLTNTLIAMMSKIMEKLCN